LILKTLLVTTTVIEMSAGLALAIVPSAVSMLLLGSSLDAPVAVMVGRVAGVALFTLGIACWLARRDGKSDAARGLVTAMLAYNILVSAILTFASLGAGLKGIALWPAVIFHAAMAIWCMICLQKKGELNV